VSVTTGPEDSAAAGRGRLRAGHADRKQAIDTLKTAFVHGQLTKDELDARAGQALVARTYADLDSLTADIPPRPPAARSARPPGPVRRRPLARAATKSGVCLIIAAAAWWVWVLLVSGDGDYDGIPGANPPHESWAAPALLVFFAAVCTAIGILGSAVVSSLEQRRSRGQLPPQPRGDLETGRHRGTGHSPVPPGHRTHQAQADLRAHKSRQRQRHIPTGAARASRGVRPTPTRSDARNPASRCALLGGSTLGAGLLAAGLIDGLRLMVNPVVPGPQA
jgi:Domain of unknown function (DUF1707)